ncbi:MAG TPA: L,D-transpeptidase family protein [Acidimicrobiales bacterium]|nr:L,D-transpeptidase family protein [Acidimicrobiales bacterium]
MSRSEGRPPAAPRGVPGPRRALALALAGAILAGCGGAAAGLASSTTTSPATTTSASTATPAMARDARPVLRVHRLPHRGAPRHHVPVVTTTIPAPPTTSTTTPPPTTTTTPPPPPPLLVQQLASVDGATQVITVEASGFGATTATVEAFGRDSHGRWLLGFGPVTAELGFDGLAPAGRKSEGDGRTPSGIFALGRMFGIMPNPGVTGFSYQQVSSRDVWVDDPQSKYYNLEETLPDSRRWRQTVCYGADGCYSGAEPLDNPTAYPYAVVVQYNTGRVVAGAGSAIFFHVSAGQPTTGCVAIPEGELVAIMRWLRPQDRPVIVIGTSSTITSY